MAEPRRGGPRLVEPEPIASVPTEAQPTEPSEPAATEGLPSQPESRDESQVGPQPQPDAQPQLQPERQQPLQPQQPQTLSEMIALVDDGWRQFLRAAQEFPSERMDERLSEGWTRKQMLAHISAWHDLTHDRLGKLMLTGESADMTENADAINARVARQAIGRTAGETLKEMETTFNRLRRQLGRMTDEQLAADDGWATHVIAANTYDHYEEHRADVDQPPQPDGRSGRRA